MKASTCCHNIRFMVRIAIPVHNLQIPSNNNKTKSLKRHKKHNPLEYQKQQKQKSKPRNVIIEFDLNSNKKKKKTEKANPEIKQT